MSFVVVSLLSLLVFIADVRATAGNMGVVWNGYGAIRPVLDGESMAPMQYRVLIPWLASLFSEPSQLKYLIIKFVGIVGAIAASWLWFAHVGVDPVLATTCLAGFLVAAAVFDYADAYWEIALFSTSFLLIAIGGLLAICLLPPLCFVGALNRETIVFVPITIGLHLLWGIDPFHLAMFLVTLLSVTAGIHVPHRRYGDRERYCDFNMVSTNLKRIHDGIPVGGFGLLNGYVHFGILLVAVVGGYIATGLSRMFTPVEIGMALFFLSMLVPTVWGEIRVFAPVMLVLIPMFL